MTEVVVVLDELDDDQTRQVVQKLQDQGMEVFKVDHDESIVEGAIETARIRTLHALQHVRYVRSVLTYTVEYPPGDPRNSAGPEDDDDGVGDNED